MKRYEGYSCTIDHFGGDNLFITPNPDFDPKVDLDDLDDNAIIISKRDILDMIGDELKESLIADIKQKSLSELLEGLI